MGSFLSLNGCVRRLRCTSGGTPNQSNPGAASCLSLALLNFVGWAADVCLLFRHGLHIERVGGPVLRFRGLCEERQDKTKLLQWRDRLGLLDLFPFSAEVPDCSHLGSLILTTGTAPGVRPAGVLGGKVAALGNFRYARVLTAPVPAIGQVVVSEPATTIEPENRREASLALKPLHGDEVAVRSWRNPR